MMPVPAPPVVPPDADLAALLALVTQAQRQLHGDTPGLPAVSLDSHLERDLGFDSLGRMELLLRVERRFGVALPEDSLQLAETVADLWQALQRAGPAPAAGAITAAPPVAGPGIEHHAAPASARTLIEVLEWHLARHPRRVHATCLSDGAETPLRYQDLADGSAAVAAGLQRHGLQPGRTVAIMLPTGPDYFFTYLGILRAGGIPVPIYPPARPTQLEDHVRRHVGILANAEAALMVTPPEAQWVGRLLQARLPGMKHLLSPAELRAEAAAPHPVPLRADDVAFIQYTSGSTGQPKGVALTHANLLANIRAMAEAVQATPDDVFVSWLPLYHDMGLIGAWLGSLYVGMPLVVMSPLAFLARPERWLQAITRFRGTISAGPNFAYDLCLKRLDDATVAGLDLSSWRWAFNGAEAVSAETLQRFAARFAACGLRPGALAPVYGLAESAVGLLFPPPDRGPLIDHVQREPLAREHRALPAAADDARALRIVACGRPLAGHAVRIVDDEGHELGERVEGRLEFKGPSATRGYWRSPEQTARLFDGDWLDTGDRAYVADGEVYVTGRVKDIVIRGGRNLYPQEIEEAVGAVGGVRKGGVAVFGSPDPQRGTERLVVLAEVATGTAGDAATAARLREAVNQAVIAAIGEPADTIVLAPPRTVLKTSSGKVRRSACRELYEQGRIGTPQAGAGRQVLRLVLQALAVQGRRFGARLRGAGFGLRTMLCFWLLAPPVWLLTLAMPSPAAAWALCHRAARLLLRLAGVPLQVSGLERWSVARPGVIVCNHASYLDGMVLVAALPWPCAFVAKRELEAQFVAGRFLARLGAVFVERVDPQRSVADAARIAERVRDGVPLLVFPEGTFGPQPGLLPFHLGGFLAAAQARAPVLPLTLLGTRQMLPDGRWWPRRAGLAVQIHTPIEPDPDADLFAAAVRLRDAARAVIARRLESGE
jgi:1-acyl-sn-glycerol-3-phosphate acyltransferase